MGYARNDYCADRALPIEPKMGDMMPLMVVLLYLTITDADTGNLLYSLTRQMPEFSVSGDRIEECRIEGVEKAKALAARYRLKYPNAVANVDCQWERETAPA